MARPASPALLEKLATGVYIVPHRRHSHANPRESPDAAASNDEERLPLESLTEQQVACLLRGVGLGKYAQSALSLLLQRGEQAKLALAAHVRVAQPPA